VVMVMVVVDAGGAVDQGIVWDAFWWTDARRTTER